MAMTGWQGQLTGLFDTLAPCIGVYAPLNVYVTELYTECQTSSEGRRSHLYTGKAQTIVA